MTPNEPNETEQGEHVDDEANERVAEPDEVAAPPEPTDEPGADHTDGE